MSACKKGTSPIDVQPTKNQCTLTCLYQFDYKDSSLTIENKKTHLVLSYDAPQSKITFNEEHYKVQEIRLYAPSLNKYQGRRYDAELIVHHIHEDGSNLLVCVPIQSSSSKSTSASLFEEMFRFAPQPKETASINIHNYNLNHFIPRGAYYTYEGSLPYQPCDGTYHIILFDPKLAISMSPSSHKELKTLIQDATTSIPSSSSSSSKSPPLFYNPQGTQSREMMKSLGQHHDDDEIYIDCQPVNQEGEVYVPPATKDYATTFEWKHPSKEQMEYIYASSGIIGGILIIYGAYRVIQHFKK